MKKLATWAWVVVIMILGGGFYGFYILAAIGAVMLLIMIFLLIRQAIRECKPSTEEQDTYVLELLAGIDDRQEFEKERKAFIEKWGHDPGTFEEYSKRLKV